VDMSSASGVRTLRGISYWNSANPRAGQGDADINPESGGKQYYQRQGYAWADPDLKVYQRSSLLVGADQGTAAHYSGHVAALCGAAGESFRAPSVQAVVANAMAARFPDRLLPNVDMGGSVDGLRPAQLNLPAAFSPYFAPGSSTLADSLSDRQDSAWKGLRKRSVIPDLKYDGSAGTGTVPVSAVDRLLLEDARRFRGVSSPQSDAQLEGLYNTYKGVSKAMARDVVTALEKSKGFEHITKFPLYANPMDATFFIGGANAAGPMRSAGDFEFALRLLKSDLCTSVTMKAGGLNNATFDTHGPGAAMHTNQLRVAFEGVGQLIAEMAMTPSSTPGRSLLDDTMVYVYSEFGRSFMNPGAHHPTTCAIIAGGMVEPNKMFGGYNEDAPWLGSTKDSGAFPGGVPVAITEEDGARSTRVPRASEVVSTVMAGFGLAPQKDFFIPGGFGVFDGAIKKA
jgi:Protein of unknown function (DUF1501)